MQNTFSGHMVAVMALMEASNYRWCNFNSIIKNEVHSTKISSLIKHSFTGSVLLITGSLIIGFIASDQQALGIKPFTTDMFKGF
jgi:hypothetical protein